MSCYVYCATPHTALSPSCLRLCRCAPRSVVFGSVVYFFPEQAPNEFDSQARSAHFASPNTHRHTKRCAKWLRRLAPA
eukprot:3091921-Pleurochrysis_carterae.AAC.2